MPSSRGSSWHRDGTRVSYVSYAGRWVLHPRCPRPTYHLPQFPTFQSSPPQCSAYQATRSLQVCVPSLAISLLPWVGSPDRWTLVGSRLRVFQHQGGCSFLPAQPGRAVWGCPRPPGSGVGKPPGLQSNLKPDSARAPGQLTVGPSRLCGYQEACLCAVPWPAIPGSAGMAPADCCLPASLEQPSRLLLVA